MSSQLPNGKQQFIDGSGLPLNGGNVYHYIPGTSTPKTTYQDKALTTANPNPVPLDARGQAVIWGSGDYRQVLYDALGNLIWDQVISDISSAFSSLSTSLSAPGGASLIGFLPTGIGATATTVQAALDQFNQKSTGHFFSDLGGKINRIADRMFVGTSIQTDGLQTQAAGDWTFTKYSVAGVSAFGYLDHWATLAVGSPNGQPSLVSTTLASNGGGGNAAIGISSVVVNDTAIGGGSTAWNYYGTTVRDAAAIGFNTFGMELDVTNLGAAVPIYPSLPFVSGVTANLWIAAGGELPNQAGGTYTINNVSAAMAIVANGNPSYTNNKYDKGIVFAANALNANGIAIAFATGHSMTWFNTSNQSIGNITSSAITPATAQKLDLSAFGMLIQDSVGATQFQVQNTVSSAVNFISVVAAPTGIGPSVTVQGTDANSDLKLIPKGTGQVWLGGYTAGTFAQTGYIAVKDSSGTPRRLMVG